MLQSELGENKEVLGQRGRSVPELGSKASLMISVCIAALGFLVSTVRWVRCDCQCARRAVCVLHELCQSSPGLRIASTTTAVDGFFVMIPLELLCSEEEGSVI